MARVRKEFICDRIPIDCLPPTGESPARLAEAEQKRGNNIEIDRAMQTAKECLIILRPMSNVVVTDGLSIG
jgi:hypothetical protein